MRREVGQQYIAIYPTFAGSGEPQAPSLAPVVRRGCYDVRGALIKTSAKEHCDAQPLTNTRGLSCCSTGLKSQCCRRLRTR